MIKQNQDEEKSQNRVLKHVIWDVINKVASRTKSYTKFSVKSRHIGLRNSFFKQFYLLMAPTPKGGVEIPPEGVLIPFPFPLFSF